LEERRGGNACGVTQTDDERWIVVDGRRWRAIDPTTPWRGPIRIAWRPDTTSVRDLEPQRLKIAHRR